MVQATKKKAPLVPKLRFKEFAGDGEWEVKKIGEICKSFSGGTPSTTQKKFYGGDIPFIRSAEINNNKTELFITSQGLDNSSAKLVSKGDVLVALYGANSGDVAISKINGAINQAILCLKCAVNSKLIFHYITFKKEWIVATYIQGGQGNLSAEILKSINIYLPIASDQQQRIADCLTTLDENITAESQKLDALSAHKKALMQKLFPAEGEKVPALRFKEFAEDGEWEEKRLGEICKMQAGKFIQASEIYDVTNDNFYPCYGGNGLRGYTQTYTHSGTYSLIGRQGALCGNITIAKKEFYATEHAIVTTPVQYIVTEWLYYKLLALNLNQFATGQAQPGLSVDNLGKISVHFPTHPEQQLIANCLTSIDEYITAHGRKIALLKEHKKGLMQQLFPRIEEENV